MIARKDDGVGARPARKRVAVGAGTRLLIRVEPDSTIRTLGDTPTRRIRALIAARAL